MRFFDSVLALPALLLALLLLGTLGPSRQSVLLVIVVVYIPIVARVVRGVVLSVKTRSYIEAARIQGKLLPESYFAGRFPAVLPDLAVEAALRFSYAIFLASSLGFLGVGVQPPSPDWGLMVNEAHALQFRKPLGRFISRGSNFATGHFRKPTSRRIEIGISGSSGYVMTDPVSFKIRDLSVSVPSERESPGRR